MKKRKKWKKQKLKNKKKKQKNEKIKKKSQAAKYPKSSQVSGFTRKIYDDFKGLLLLLLQLFSMKSSTISMIFSERVFSQKKSNIPFGGLTVSLEKTHILYCT